MMRYFLLLVLLVTSDFIQLSLQMSSSTGICSFYGKEVGRNQPTASGEIFNWHDLTAAHMTLPFGTKIVVTNKRNQKSVVVRVNDRGPRVAGRIVDLSYAAARQIGMVSAGLTPCQFAIVT